MSESQLHTILCVEHENCCLYAEMIQLAECRPLYWVRPIALRVALPPSPYPKEVLDDKFTLHDLRQEVDLLLPCCLFRSAFDTEFLPLLVALSSQEQKNNGDRPHHERLRHFISGICQAYPDAFVL